jgi:hypothetical protein
MEMTRGEMQDLLVKFSLESPRYRQALLENPREVVQKQFAIDIPSNVNIRVVEDSASTVHIVLPHTVQEGAELSDADLEAVAGGHSIVKEANCDEGTVSTVVNMEASLGL